MGVLWGSPILEFAQYHGELCLHDVTSNADGSKPGWGLGVCCVSGEVRSAQAQHTTRPHHIHRRCRVREIRPRRRALAGKLLCLRLPEHDLSLTVVAVL